MNQPNEFREQNNNEQLKAGIYISYLSTFVTILIQLVYIPVMIRKLGQSEYGLYSLAAGVVSYLGLFNLGLTGAYLRFYSIRKVSQKKRDVEKLNGMFLSLFLVLALVCIVCGMFLSLYPKKIFGERLTASQLQRAQLLMRILIFNIAITFPSGLFEAVIDAHERFIFHKAINFLGVILNPFLTLPLLFLGYGSVAVVVATTVVTVVKLVINVTYCLGKLKMRFCFREMEFSLLKEIAAFSIFLFLNMIIEQLNWNVDKIILGHTAGTMAVAVYAMGSQMNMVFTDCLQNVSNVFLPRVNMIAASGDYKERFNELFIRIGRIQFIILGLLISGFVFFGQYFITKIYVGEKYATSYIVTLLLVFPEMIALVQSIGMEMQRALNKHQFRSIVYLFMSLLNLGISIPLAMRFGVIGAAAGTTISLSVSHGIIMNLYYAKALSLDIKAFWFNLLHMSKGLVIPILFGTVILYHGITGILMFLICGVLYVIVYMVSMWYFGMNEQEKNSILKKRKSRL